MMYNSVFCYKQYATNIKTKTLLPPKSKCFIEQILPCKFFAVTVFGIKMSEAFHISINKSICFPHYVRVNLINFKTRHVDGEKCGNSLFVKKV